MIGNILGLMPMLVLFLGSVAALFLPARRSLVFGACCALLAAATACWPEPPGAAETPLIATHLFARGCTILWSLFGASACLLAGRYRRGSRLPGPEFAALTLFTVLGMAILSAATSLVSLFLGLETMTLGFYILIAFDRQNPTGAEAGLKYLLPGLVASALLAFGTALVFTATGTFALPDAVTLSMAGASMHGIALLGWTLIVCAVAFKASLAPFHLWTPDVYQGAPAPVTALLASGSKGAVFAVLLSSAPIALLLPMRPLLTGLAALSMIVGSFAALPQTNLKRMLAYSSIVHMGYLVLAVLVGGDSGLKTGLFYLISYAAATLAAFGLLASLSEDGEEPQQYAALEGLARRSPWRAAILCGALLSLAGFPPMAGFMAKMVLFTSSLSAGFRELVILALLSSLVSCYYYMRPILAMFRRSPIQGCLLPPSLTEGVVLGLWSIIMLTGGFYPEPIFLWIASLVP